MLIEKALSKTLAKLQASLNLSRDLANSIRRFVHLLDCKNKLSKHEI